MLKKAARLLATALGASIDQKAKAHGEWCRIDDEESLAWGSRLR
jgi:hypothetical protein